MSSNLDSVDRSSSGHSGLRDFAEQAKMRWRKTRSPDAANLLAQHEWIRKDRSLALELAYEDYCIRIDNGEQIDPSHFCQRFPWLRRSLSRQIEVDQFIRAHPQLAQAGQPQWPKRGDPLLGFRVVEEIGAGAFSRAYLCAQSDVGDRQVVVKVAYQGAFEADTMGRLSHPNIMSVHSVERDEKTQLSCLCMPFCGRSTLSDVIDLAYADQRQPTRSEVILNAARSRSQRDDRYHPVVSRMRIRSGSSYVTGVLQLAIQIAEALEHSHDRGVIHGDLKPSNVVLSIDATPLVVDFNLSIGSGEAEFTMGGTLPYMAPEKVRSLLVGPDSSDRPDGRSDVFSLGAMLHELLTGHIPFLDSVPSGEAMTCGTRMLDFQSQGLADPRLVNPSIDAGLAEFIQHCVAFEPDERPQSMTEVCAVLRRYLSRSRKSYRFLRERRRLVLLTSLMFVSGSIVGAAYHVAGPSARDQHYQAAVGQYQRAEYNEAIQNFTRSLEADLEFFPAYFGRACARLQLHPYDNPHEPLDAVRQDLFAAGSIQPQNPRVKLAWSVFYLETGDFATAVAAMEFIVKDFETAEIRNNLGFGYSKLSMMGMENDESVESMMLKADSNLRRAIELDAQLWPAHLNLAILELQRYRASGGKYVPHDGLESIRLVVEEDPTATAFYFAAKLLGVIALEQNRTELLDECVQYLENAHRRGIDLQSLKALHPFTALSRDQRFIYWMSREVPDRSPKPAVRIAMPSSMISLP